MIFLHQVFQDLYWHPIQVKKEHTDDVSESFPKKHKQVTMALHPNHEGY